MPYSSTRFDEHMKSIIKSLNYTVWLDVGAGSGKHGEMIKNILPGAHVTGIEIELDYIDKFKLAQKYDRIRPINAMKLTQEPQQIYDGIILGDILEHLPKSQGVDLVNFLIYRCKMMIVIYPIERIQNDWKGYQYEAHIAVWGEDDWKLFDYTIIEDPASHLVIVDGFIEHERIDINVFV